MNLYPIKFYPILKERLWGGTKLGTILGKELESDLVGESWEISGVNGDVSIVANGPHKGTSLTNLIDEFPEAILGKSVLERFGKEFPILIKFIDAQKDLSIQLHPNDELARKRHNSFGKTEMWYVMDSDEDAELIIGFNEDVTEEIYTESLKNNSLTDLLNYESVSEGDTYFINAGKIHAIGAGVLIAEIQQTSDQTYRVYDYNRKDADGNPRELHTELSLDAIDYAKKDDFKVSYEQKMNAANPMVNCPYFKTNFISLNQNIRFDVSDRDCFTIYMCIDGDVLIENDFGSILIKKGETVLVPASSSHILLNSEQAKLLEITV
ncbi:type I phosphomannose isomerase catalytic subunit [uncultured Eudoraea sp.]|uniref:type I phosphomannose isomerase catalytic subunit n=1 Tax=uncultured Eudoraea sp. TaxID=1035614 RepID=UPI002629A830|nr:type I phosphomannose isomerase catalytic subunit [uncultured Eudoraea sp.]